MGAAAMPSAPTMLWSVSEIILAVVFGDDSVFVIGALQQKGPDTVFEAVVSCSLDIAAQGREGPDRAESIGLDFDALVGDFVMGHVIVLRGLAHQCQGSHPLADRPDLRQAGFADVLVHHLASFGMDRLGMFDAIVSFHPPDVVGEDNFAGQLGSRDIAFGYCPLADDRTLDSRFRRCDAGFDHELDHAQQLARTFRVTDTNHVNVVHRLAERRFLPDRAGIDCVFGRWRGFDDFVSRDSGDDFISRDSGDDFFDFLLGSHDFLRCVCRCS